MKSLVQPLTLAALFAVAATSAFAQAAPNPFDNVPKLRTAEVEESGGAVDRIIGGKEADAGEYPFQVAFLPTISPTIPRASTKPSSAAAP